MLRDITANDIRIYLLLLRTNQCKGFTIASESDKLRVFNWLEDEDYINKSLCVNQTNEAPKADARRTNKRRTRNPPTRCKNPTTKALLEFLYSCKRLPVGGNRKVLK